MAVFTEVSANEAAALTRSLGAGELQAIEGISAGIENTNYFVSTDQGEWVLTLFERLQPAQLPFYLGLMQHLAQRDLPVPGPLAPWRSACRPVPRQRAVRRPARA